MDFDLSGIFTYLIKSITGGGTTGLISILVCIIGYCFWERRNLQKKINEKDDKTDELIKNYYDIVMKVSDTMNGIKQVLLIIQSKL